MSGRSGGASRVAASRSPMDEALGVVLVGEAGGEVVLSATPRAAFANADGALHGGWVAALLDAAAGAAVRGSLGPGERYATLALSVSYLRGIPPGEEPVQVTGRVLRRGRRVVTCEARLVDHGSNVCAVGTATCLITADEA